MGTLAQLARDIRACRICEKQLPHGPRPILTVHRDASVLIAGQAPGRRVHESGVPWDDPSGDRLREWLGVDRDTFYDPERFALVPMGFCYPGSGRSGDLPPRAECREAWHGQLIPKLRGVELTLLVGQYAQKYHLGDRAKPTLTATVAAWREYAPDFVPTPHPSPRNAIWLRKNRWFETDLLPSIRKRVRAALG